MKWGWSAPLHIPSPGTLGTDTPRPQLAYSSPPIEVLGADAISDLEERRLWERLQACCQLLAASEARTAPYIQLQPLFQTGRDDASSIRKLEAVLQLTPVVHGSLREGARLQVHPVHGLLHCGIVSVEHFGIQVHFGKV